MITLVEHLRERIQIGFTVNNTVSDKIILFDLDDTIIHTTAKISVFKDGECIKKLTNAEFNDYVLKPGESFGFEEFNDFELLSKSKFTPYWETLKREYKKGTHVGILTARGNCQMIRKFFMNNGIKIKTELVMAINDPNLGLSGSVQQRKSEAISILAKAGYKLFVFFDDNEPNLKSAKKLEKEYNIKVQTVKV